MRLFEQIGALRAYVRGMRAEGKLIGFVPTMGALHEGHLSLISKAKADCDVVIASVFVNPMQFGPGEDLDAYPRTLARDQQLTSNLGLDAMFVPARDEMYPVGFQTTVQTPVLASVLEGAHRPGHFTGVATVVLKLFNMVQADRAYFGQKDYQQVLVIERMVRDLNLNTEIISVPTVRDTDGLALSSRNAYLNPEERVAATVLFRALEAARKLAEAGEASTARILFEMNAEISSEPLASPDYVQIVHPETLEPVTELTHSLAVAILAVRIGKTRLIDNMFIAPPGVVNARARASKA